MGKLKDKKMNEYLKNQLNISEEEKEIIQEAYTKFMGSNYGENTVWYNLVPNGGKLSPEQGDNLMMAIFLEGWQSGVNYGYHT